MGIAKQVGIAGLLIASATATACAQGAAQYISSQAPVIFVSPSRPALGSVVTVSYSKLNQGKYSMYLCNAPGLYAPVVVDPDDRSQPPVVLIAAFSVSEAGTGDASFELTNIAGRDQFGKEFIISSPASTSFFVIGNKGTASWAHSWSLWQ